MFKNWKKGDDPFKKYPVPIHPPIKKTETFIMNYPAKNPLISAKWKGPDVGKDNPSTYALDVFFTALNLPSSKFQKNLVLQNCIPDINNNKKTVVSDLIFLRTILMLAFYHYLVGIEY